MRRPPVAGFVLMGTSSYLMTNSDEGDIGVVGYFPLIAVSIIAVAYHIGIGPIPWSYSGNVICPSPHNQVYVILTFNMSISRTVSPRRAVVHVGFHKHGGLTLHLPRGQDVPSDERVHDDGGSVLVLRLHQVAQCHSH